MKLEYATAIRDTLSRGYNFKDFVKDLGAGAVVSLVSLPLAMALAIAVGLDPEHGVYTAIVAGFIASLLGGSYAQISGPTGAFVVILAPIVIEFGVRGLIIAQILASVIIIVMAVFRVGFIIKYIPYSVTVGFTTGIAFVLCIISLKDLLGIKIDGFNGYLPNKIFLIFQNLNKITFGDTFIGILTIAIIKLWDKFKIQKFKIIPSIVVSIVTVTLITIFLNNAGFKISTIESDFSYIDDETGKSESGIPDEPPQLHFFNFDNSDPIYAFPTLKEIGKLLPAAIMIAILASLESLLAATMADNMTGSKHNPNSELLGIGTANLFSAFALGMPATGALARTAANIRSGARSPISGLACSILILLYVLVFHDQIDKIPLSALYAILMLVAIRMAEIHEFKKILKSKIKEDIIILITTFLLTAIFDMVIGVTIGVIISFFLIIKKISDHNPVFITKTTDDNLKIVIKGPIFFSNTNKIFNQDLTKHLQFNKLILDLTKVNILDVSGLSELEGFIEANSNKNIYIIANDYVNDIISKFINLNNVKIIRNESEVV
ncbi:MAG: STAS domain-containing protein [Sphingobacteriia bacterium]|nr:STAS domain-containing protein [Sphingobacteriia bacterium]